MGDKQMNGTTEVKVHEPDKISFWDKLKFCYLILRYGNSHMRYRRTITCEQCGGQFLLSLEGAQKRSEQSGSKVYENTLACMNCGAIGTEIQVWHKNEGKDERA